MTAALLAGLGLPLVTGFAVLGAGRWPALREAATLIGALALALWVARLVAAYDPATALPVTLTEVLPGIALRFRAEPIGLVFAAVASSLWVLNSLYSIAYMRAERARHQTRFYACFAFALAATMGVALADNLVTLFLFYELLTLVTYPLVVHWQTPAAIRGGRLYLGYLLGTSLVPFLGAVLWSWAAAGTVDFRIGGVLGGKLDDGAMAVLLGLYAWGVGKAALMPLHGWLPAAMVAPTPVSALLHAVAVVKAGVFTLLKIAVYVFGIDTLAQGVGTWLVWVAAASMVAASAIALTKDDLKARLAYSTVAQLALVTLAVALGHPLAIAAGVLQMVAHAYGKITLFFGAGAIQIAAHRKRVSELDGLGHALPLLFAALLVASLSVAGLPPFAGLWAKYYLLTVAWERQDLALLAVLGLSSLLTLAYLLPIVVRGVFGAPRWPYHIDPLPVGALVPPLVTACGCLALFFAGPAIVAFLLPALGGAP